eukprot:scaffold14056_cov119-Isochrysis_galbana.AAC.1
MKPAGRAALGAQTMNAPRPGLAIEARALPEPEVVKEGGGRGEQEGGTHPSERAWVPCAM